MKKIKQISYTQVNKRVFGYITDRTSQGVALRIFRKARFEQSATPTPVAREKMRGAVFFRSTH